jgi:hypothetical protein
MVSSTVRRLSGLFNTVVLARPLIHEMLAFEMNHRALIKPAG